MLSKQELDYVRSKGKIAAMGTDYVVVKTAAGTSIKLSFDKVRAAVTDLNTTVNKMTDAILKVKPETYTLPPRNNNKETLVTVELGYTWPKLEEKAEVEEGTLDNLTDAEKEKIIDALKKREEDDKTKANLPFYSEEAIAHMQGLHTRLENIAAITEAKDADHAKLAPSSMKMFKNCYASLLTPAIPIPEIPSAYAQEGTNAHELFASAAAILLKSGLDEAVNAIPSIPVEKDAEMIEHITALIVHCDKLLNAIGKDCILSVLIEKKVNFSKHIYGTIDFGILYVKDNKKKIYALDLKYGKGVAVPAKDNEQLLTYVLSIIESEHWDATEAILAIYQPRNRDHSEEPLDTYTIDAAYIKKARANLKRFETMALKVLAGTKKPREKVGDWCMFCKRKAVCKTYSKEAAVPGLLVLDKAPPLKKPNELTDKQLDLVLRNADKIKSFIKAVEEYVAGRCTTSNPLPGWKLVAGKSIRKWLENTSEVAVYLMNQGIENPYRNVLIGIGEAEKQLGKDKTLLEPVTTKSVPKAKLVEESDPRPALTNVEDTLKMLSIIEGD